MTFSIIQGDITNMRVDAIVNAANTELAMGSGVCGAIFRAAGSHQMTHACSKLAPINIGEAVITPGFKLDAKYVIHAVGPIYENWDKKTSERLLKEAYINSMILAKDYGLESIAFPLISSGIYGYPKKEAFEVATNAIKNFIDENELEIYLVLLDKNSLVLGEMLSTNIQNYLKDYSDVLDIHDNQLNRIEVDFGIEDILQEMDNPFNMTLFKLIDSKKMSDVEVYKRANIDRKHFSKIRSSSNYIPSKKTILALAIALELNLEETKNLLEKAGFALTRNQKFDIIVEYFIINEIYDIYEINQVLFKYDQPILGSN